jgi:hypothetical protein
MNQEAFESPRPQTMTETALPRITIPLTGGIRGAAPSPPVSRRREKSRDKTFVAFAPLIDGNARARLFQFAKAYNQRHKTERQHQGPITAAFWRVLNALLEFCNKRTGACFPSYEKIAERACCKRSSVYAAIHVLERARLLTWAHGLRRERVEHDDPARGFWKGGWRVVRTANVYRFFDPNPNAEAQQNQTQNQKSENRFGTRVQQNLMSLGTSVAAKIALKPPESRTLLEVLQSLGHAIAEDEAKKQQVAVAIDLNRAKASGGAP